MQVRTGPLRPSRGPRSVSLSGPGSGRSRRLPAPELSVRPPAWIGAGVRLGLDLGIGLRVGRRRVEAPGEVGLGDPAGLDAGLHDHLLGLLARQLEAVEHAGVAHALAVLALGPADQVVGGAAGEILDRLDVVLAERHHHLGGDAVDLAHARPRRRARRAWRRARPRRGPDSRGRGSGARRRSPRRSPRWRRAPRPGHRRVPRPS